MQIDLIGVPMDFGAGRRGVDMGPSAIRYAGLREGLVGLGHEVNDLGNIEVPILETCQVTDPRLRYVDCTIPVARRIMGQVANTVRAGHFPLVLGGDHSLSLGSVRGAARHKKLGVIWVDAHADFNTHETTPSGNIHGMPLAALCGLGDPRLVVLEANVEAGASSAVLDPARVAIVGARDLDSGEKANLHRAGAHVFSIDQIDRRGMFQIMQQAIDIASTGTEGIYLSFDLDALDPLHAPGVGTPVPGGISNREAHLVCEMLAETGVLVGVEVVEVNPILDERNKTAALAVELALSALGKRVW